MSVSRQTPFFAQPRLSVGSSRNGGDAMIKSLTDSFLAMLGHVESEDPEVVIERVRRAILQALEDHVDSLEVKEQLEHTVLYAIDIETLWYVRPELMSMISVSRSEYVAQQCMTHITAMFTGQNPGPSSSKFGSL
jgi:hypothetical protein